MPFFLFSTPKEATRSHFYTSLFFFRSVPTQILPSCLRVFGGFSYHKTTSSIKKYQIEDLFIVDLHVSAGHLYLLSFLPRSSQFKNILQHSGQDSSRLGVRVTLQVRQVAQNRKGFACPSLSVGENTAIVSLSFR